MKLIGRRNFVTGLGLGAGASLLMPFCRRIIGEAIGQPLPQRRFMFVTQGNAWNHEGDTKGSTPATNTGQKSAMFNAPYRSSQDFDLPAFMEAFAPYKKEVSIWFGLTNFNQSDANHGPQRSLLNAVDVKVTTGAISIDRFLGKELKAKYGDIHDSTNVGPTCASYGGKDPRSPSMDGPGRNSDAYMTPVQAFAAYFGAAAGMSAPQTAANVDLDRSLFDGMRDDLARARKRLAGTRDVEKFDQATQSLREFEKRLSDLRTDPRVTGTKPAAPTLDSGAMTKEVIRGLADLSVQAQAFGLTHVSHLALHGSAAFDQDSWKVLAGPDFSNYGENHNGLFHTTTLEGSENIRKMHRYVAAEIAWMRAQLGAVRVGTGTLADETVIVWIVQGGLRHHGGSDGQLMVLLAGSQSRVKAPYWPDFFTAGSGNGVKGQYHMGQAYVSLANAAGLGTTTFGAGQGPLPDVLRA